MKTEFGKSYMNIEKIKNKSSDGQHELAGHVYVPDGEIKGLFHVVHGMTEHIERYDGFMRTMASSGYVCFGYDNLGHGYTAKDDSELGFIAHKDGYKFLARDVRLFSDKIREAYDTNLPYYLMGHSMGSFIVRYSAVHYTSPDKLIIMGTGGKNPAAGIGIALIKIMKLFKGEKYISKTVDKMAFGMYNEKFNENDNYSWLTKDTEIRDKFRNDKYCTFKFTLSAMQDLITLNRETNKNSWFNSVKKAMPVLLVSGEDDPVGDYGRGVTEVYDKLRSAGCDVNLKLYKNCRHEILNDSCREETVKDILEFIEKR